MSNYIIYGGHRLEGEIDVSGSNISEASLSFNFKSASFIFFQNIKYNIL